MAKVALTMCVCVLRFLQSYEQAFEQIKEATGTTDIDQLVTKFIEGQHNRRATLGSTYL